MLTSMKSALPRALTLVVLVAALAACSDDDADAVKKDVDELRADLQRAQKENEKLRSQVATAEGRLNGLAEDLARVRQLSVQVNAAPAPQSEGDAADAADAGTAPPPAVGGVSPGAAALLATPEGVAIKTFLSTDDGKKLLEAAIQSERESRARDQERRRVDALVDRFAKTASLTDDQTRRMKDVMQKQADASRAAWASLPLGPDATQADRDARRQQGIAKTDELRKATDDQIRTILSTTQFETYQQEQDKLRQRLRGTGGANGGGGGGANGARRNNAGGRGTTTNGN